jgi:hypothetical protein
MRKTDRGRNSHPISTPKVVIFLIVVILIGSYISSKSRGGDYYQATPAIQSDSK